MSRPIVVTVGPLASASATKVSLSQKSAVAGYLVLNGAAGSFAANNVCLSQTPGAADNLTLNGSLAATVAGASAAVAYLPAMQRIYITTAADESAKTFTITGLGFSIMGSPYAITETITGAVTSTVSSQKTYAQITSIAVSAATTGAITVGTYGTATLDVARRVLFTSAGNDSGITLTVIGTNQAGAPTTEVVTGANATTAVTLLDYLTVTSIQTSAAVATTVTVGTNGVAASPWARMDNLGSLAPVAIQVDGSGTVNWSIQQTLNDPNVITNQLPTPTYLYAPSAVAWVNHPDSNLVSSAVTTGVQGNYAYKPIFARVLLNSGSGTVTATFAQSYQG